MDGSANRRRGAVFDSHMKPAGHVVFLTQEGLTKLHAVIIVTKTTLYGTHAAYRGTFSAGTPESAST